MVYEKYDRILQHRNLYISQRFAENSEETVQKSSRQTTSMYIITVVTLIFLPATFVAVRMALYLFSVFSTSI